MSERMGLHPRSNWVGQSWWSHWRILSPGSDQFSIEAVHSPKIPGTDANSSCLLKEERRKQSHIYNRTSVSHLVHENCKVTLSTGTCGKPGVGVACSLCNHPWQGKHGIKNYFAYLLSSVSCFLGYFSCWFSALLLVFDWKYNSSTAMQNSKATHMHT